LKERSEATVRLVLAVFGFVAFLAGCKPINFYGTLDQGGAGQPGVLTILPSLATLSPSNQITFSAAGGVPPYAYSITSGGGSISGATFTAPSVSGTTTVQVTDAAAGTSTATVTTINPLSINPNSVSLYTSMSYTFDATGGTSPYTYSIVSGTGTLSGATYTAPASPGSAVVQVKDSTSSTSSATITVTSPPPPLSITPATVSLQTNGSITFTASGGVPPYAFVQTSGGGALSGATYTAPSSAGTAIVQVQDSVLSTASAVISITAATGVLAISPTTVQLGAGGTIIFSATGGTSPYVYSMVSGTGTLSGATYTAPASAPATATVRVTDSVAATSDASVTIVAPPLSISPGVAYVVINGGTSFSASGGTGGYVFSMVSGGGSVTAAGVYSASSTAGSASVKVTDSASNTVTAVLTIYDPFVIVPSSVTIKKNTQLTFSATGGVPACTFSVASGPGSINPSTGVYSAPASAATGIIVKAVDAIGNTSTSSVTVHN
jgi:hypothetical protein